MSLRDIAEIVVDDGAHLGDENMARDRALFELAENGQIGARVYEWIGPWVSLGVSQDPSKTLLPGCSVPTTRRPTGGKAVLHGHDLTIGLSIPVSPENRSVKKSYRFVVPYLVWALNDAGIPAALGEDTPFVRAAGRVADCFAHVAPNDIVDPATGRKVCGCALKLGRGSVLVQASIPIKTPLVDPHDVFPEPGPSHPVMEVTRADLVQSLTRSLTQVHF